MNFIKKIDWKSSIKIILFSNLLMYAVALLIPILFLVTGTLEQNEAFLRNIIPSYLVFFVYVVTAFIGYFSAKYALKNKFSMLSTTLFSIVLFAFIDNFIGAPISLADVWEYFLPLIGYLVFLLLNKLK
jgi:hypothetical protein